MPKEQEPIGFDANVISESLIMKCLTAKTSHYFSLLLYIEVNVKIDFDPIHFVIAVPGFIVNY